MSELDNRRVTKAELEKVGVEWLGDLVALRCVVCNSEWEVFRDDRSGFLPRDYWHCQEQGCNTSPGS